MSLKINDERLIVVSQSAGELLTAQDIATICGVDVSDVHEVIDAAGWALTYDPANRVYLVNFGDEIDPQRFGNWASGQWHITGYKLRDGTEVSLTTATDSPLPKENLVKIPASAVIHVYVNNQ